MKLSAQGKFRLAAKLAFAAGAGSLLGVAHAAAADDAPASGASAAAAKDANLQLAQAGTGTATTAPASTGTPVQLQGVEVTGSRIKQPSLTSTSALQSINDQEFKLEGTQNVESLLNSLPQSFASQNNTVANGATGTATVNLRGLGTARTLVLIDGQRVTPGDPRGGPEVDLNFIPAALVDRVDVLTGGASSIYGSDALAGVVNFIMKKDFDGFQVDGQVNRTGMGDGTSYDTTLVWGSNFAGGAGNVTLFAGHTRFDAVNEGQRDFSRQALKASKDTLTHQPSGSGTVPAARFYSYNCAGGVTNPDGSCGQYVGYFQTDPQGTQTFVADTPGRFNFAPFNFLQRSDQRYNLGGFAHREFNEHADVYGSVLFMDDRTTSQIAPSGTFFHDFKVNCDNPLLSAQEVAFACTQNGLGPNDNIDALIAKRTIEFQPRQDDLRHTDYRIQFGIRGSIIDDWSYDLSAHRGESVLAENFLHDVSVSRTQQALQATTDANGNIVCKDPTGGCVPFNLFRFGNGAITPAQIAFVEGTGFQQGNTVEEDVNANITGDLTRYGIVSPLAKTGVGVAFGYEYRKESLDTRTDQEFQSGDLAGQGGPLPSVKGNFNVKEYFGELNLPIVENQPYVKSFKIDTSYRISNYTTAARYTHSYKFGASYFPIEDIGVRGSWSRAVRAPDIQELFFPASVGLFSGNDPCAGAVDPATGLTAAGASAAQCARSGVTPTQFGKVLPCSAGQCNALFGGNLDLQAEKAITRQAGLVLQPRFLKGFSGTIDFYQITISNRIGTLGAQTILNQCVFSGGDCSGIHRSPLTGSLFGPTTNFVTATNINTGFLKERGIDFGFSYNRYLSDLGLGDNGRLQMIFTGTYLSSLKQKNGPGVPAFDCAGLFGVTCSFQTGGGVNPRWRHKLRTTWLAPSDSIIAGLGVSVQWRYISGVKLDQNTGNPALGGQHNSDGSPKILDQVDANILKRQYVDLTLTYHLPISTQDVTLRFGVNNLNDRDPPVVSSVGRFPISGPPFGNGNTFPGTYDSLGRVMYLGVTANFR
ncbi:MAG: TonB-dependent receptor [Gammaproteobacteria bacterium]|nr:TonB-dependent receptor [Gammaproteobacteria bacterium]